METGGRGSTEDAGMDGDRESRSTSPFYSPIPLHHPRSKRELGDEAWSSGRRPRARRQQRRRPRQQQCRHTSVGAGAGVVVVGNDGEAEPTAAAATDVAAREQGSGDGVDGAGSQRLLADAAQPPADRPSPRSSSPCALREREEEENYMRVPQFFN
uniref:Uncharacterized protein n=1 Tax=Oryza nivara TaxID=4536 RepID=A0A0E0G3R4_ORYNI